LLRKTTRRKLADPTFKDFEMVMVLGRGAFGKVFLARLKTNNTFYAVKSIRKDILIEMDQIESTILEKDIMLEADHPFLVGMDFMY